MFLKNWYNALGQAMSAANATTTYVNTSGSEFTQNNSIDVNVVKIGDYSDTSNYSPSMRNVRTTISSYTGVIFGSGTTPPTIDDYKLSGDIITTISAAVNHTFTTDDDGSCYQCLYTITNTGTSEITIGEVALFAGAASSSSKKFLVERTVLDSPVTIPAGGIGQVTYAIRLNYPAV